MISTDLVRQWWIEADGRRLHQLDFGGSGHPVVCLHGVTSCAWVWHHAARYLSPAGRVLACDLRGHGDSGWAPPDRYRTVDHAADVEAVLVTLDSLGAAPVDLVGSSWGALVGLAVAVDRPEAVRRLVLVDIEPSFSQSETDVPARPARLAGLKEATAVWRAANPSAPDDLVRLLAAAATRPAPDGGLVPAHDPVFLERWPFRSENWWDALDAVEAPTLVVRGEKSWVSANVCNQMAERLARSERVDIIGSTHVVPVDAPDELGLAVAGFLSE
jgi:pimeloyl-ACP methyl ester carboxylesterase